MSHLPIAVNEGYDRARHERCQEQLDAKSLGQRGKSEQEHHRPTHADLRCGVLQPAEQRRKSRKPLSACDGEASDPDGKDETH